MLRSPAMLLAAALTVGLLGTLNPAPARAAIDPAAATDSSAVPAVGQPAPDFTLPSTAGGRQALKKLHGKTVVLYFYPKDETAGCTHEACDFRDHVAELKHAGVVVFGVSTDDLDSHHHFIAKEHLSFPLLADVDGSVCHAYGVLRARTRDGRTMVGIERTTFVIGRDGRIARVWPKVDVNGHVDAVLAFVKGTS